MNKKDILNYIIKNITGIHILKTFLLFLSIILGSFLSIYPIVLMRDIIDLALLGEKNNISSIVFNGIIYLIIQILRACIVGITSFYSKKIQAEISLDVQVKVFEKLQKVKLETFKMSNKAFLNETIIHDTQYISQNMVDPFVSIVRSIFSFIFGIYYMSKINFNLIFLILPLCLISSLMIKKVSNKSYQNITKQRQYSETLWSTYKEGILAFLPVRLHNYSHIYLQKVKKEGEALKGNQIYQGKLESATYIITSSLFMVTIGIIMIISSIMIIKGSLSIGGLTAILMYNHMLVDPLLVLQEVNQKIIKLKVSISRVFEIIMMEEDNIEKSQFKLSHIKLENVSFKIGRKTILSNVNLSLDSPKSVLIMGKTGAGKSTLTNLISGIYTSYEGSITYLYKNGISKLKPKLSCLLQDEYLFDDSIKNNIRIGNYNISDEKLKKLIHICEVDEILEVHKDNKIGENGEKLSGGERKRVLLARTLANESADIYIFDEMSASLDNDSFLRLWPIVDNYISNKIRIYIEHNIVIKENVERVFLVENGTVYLNNN